MIMPPAELSSSEAERLRAFERKGHDALATSYHAFFAAVTALATDPLLDAVRLYPGIDFREADVEHLPFPDDTFDAVVCAFGLGHFPRPEVAVAESVRTLLPGGHLAFSWWDDPSRQRIQGIFRDAISEVGVSAPADVPQGHNAYRFSNTGEFVRLLEGAGLVEVAVTEHATTYSVPDTEALWRGGLGGLLL